MTFWSWLLLFTYGVLSIEVTLQANWSETPFKLNVLETVTKYNASLYSQLVENLFNLRFDEEEGELIIPEIGEDYIITDEEFYQFAMGLITDDKIKSLIEFEILNKFSSVRIQAHYNYFQSIENPCNSNFAMFEPSVNEIYCDSDAAFVLKSVSEYPLESIEFLPFDHLLESANGYKRIFFIYGDYNDFEFRYMFANMYRLIENDIALVWRYASSCDLTSQKELLTGYGIETYVEPVQIENTFACKIINYILNSEDKLKSLTSIIPNLPNYIEEVLKYNSSDLFIGTESVEGMYINGAYLDNDKVDIFNIVETIRNEISNVDTWESLGLSVHNFKLMDRKLSQSMKRQISQQSIRYDISKYKNVIVYLNDLEIDPTYKNFKPSSELYAKPNNGKIPPANENIYEIIFIIDITDKFQLRKLTEYAERILYKNMPIRIGVVPLYSVSRYSEKATSKLYGSLFENGSIEAFSYLHMLNIFVNGREGLNLMAMRALHFPYLEDLEFAHLSVYNALDTLYSELNVNEEPLVLVDGLMFPFYQIDEAFNQIFLDMDMLFEDNKNGMIPHGFKLKDCLRKEALKLRNPVLIPESLAAFRNATTSVPDLEAYQSLDSLKNRLIIEMNVEFNGTPVIIELFGSFAEAAYIEQVKEVVKFASSYKSNPLKLVIYDTSKTSEFEQLLTIKDQNELISFIDNIQPLESESIDFDIVDFLTASFGFRPTENYLFISGRKVNLIESGFISTALLNEFINFELNFRLNSMKEVIDATMKEICNDFNKFDRFEYLSWKLSTFFFYNDNDIFSTTAPRITINSDSHIHLNKNGSIDIDLVIDPITNFGQKLVSHILWLETLPFVNLSIHFKNSHDHCLKFINRNYKLALSSSNAINQPYDRIKLDAPHHWLTTCESEGEYTLTAFLVEGYVKQKGLPLCLAEDSTFVVENGYFQLKSQPGLFEIGIKPNTIGSNSFELSNYKDSVLSFNKKIISPHLKQIEKFTEPLGKRTSNFIFDKVFSWFKFSNKHARKEPLVNVFTINDEDHYKPGFEIWNPSKLERNYKWPKWISPIFNSKESYLAIIDLAIPEDVGRIAISEEITEELAIVNQLIMTSPICFFKDSIIVDLGHFKNERWGEMFRFSKDSKQLLVSLNIKECLNPVEEELRNKNKDEIELVDYLTKDEL
ncbi:hypothetical protein DAMA08_041350 [Martiniozyma asiatica (nom. inval.)]|nr:hypothetical protein DAMA08_041350 [Martiniozyma asiatica]